MDRQHAFYPYCSKRRGSTPSLIQYATINAQIQKERTSPSLDVINNADTDDTEDEDSELSWSRSQPALNLLHVTNIRGRVNILSLPTKTNFKKSKKKEDKIKGSAVSSVRPSFGAQPVCNVIKRSSSHGVLVNDSSSTSKSSDLDERSNRRNSWCHASGTSAVAIDNKIEQAMDLVKSHLMFAVREEVEVLKEKIAELMERINQLEVENSFLRSQASPETLAQLAAQTNNTSPPSGPVS